MYYMVLNILIFAYCAYTALLHKSKYYKVMLWLSVVGASVQTWVLINEIFN